MKILSLCTAILFFISLASGLARVFLTHSTGTGLVETVFGLNQEANIPMWFQASLLLLNACLLSMIGYTHRHAHRPYGWHWQLLGIIFLLLSLDEAAVLHEKSGRFLPDAFDPDILYGWTVIGAVVVTLFALTYLRFLWHLPALIRLQFFLAGLIFVSGALGMEMVASYVNAGMGRAFYHQSLWRVVLTHVEELMEMGGVLLMLYALLSYIRLYVGTLAVSFSIE